MCVCECACVCGAAAAAAVCRDQRGISNDADGGTSTGCVFGDHPIGIHSHTHACSLRLPFVLRRERPPDENGPGAGAGAVTVCTPLSSQVGAAHSLSLSEDVIFCGCADGTVRTFSPDDLGYVCSLPQPHALGAGAQFR